MIVDDIEESLSEFETLCEEIKSKIEEAHSLYGDIEETIEEFNVDQDLQPFLEYILVSDD